MIRLCLISLLIILYGFAPQLSPIGEPIRWPNGKSTFLVYYSSEVESLGAEEVFVDTFEQIQSELNVNFTTTTAWLQGFPFSSPTKNQQHLEYVL